MLKKIIIGMLALGVSATLFAAEQNILKKTRWRSVTNAKNSIVDMVGNEFHCVNNGKGSEGVFYVEYCKPPRQGKMIFSAESKAEGIPAGAKLAPQGQYSIYIDIAYQDGTRKFGIIKAFTYANHDWEKVSGEFDLPKPVARINYHLLFRKAQGKVSFRNPVLMIK